MTAWGYCFTCREVLEDRPDVVHPGHEVKAVNCLVCLDSGTVKALDLPPAPCPRKCKSPGIKIQRVGE